MCMHIHGCRYRSLVCFCASVFNFGGDLISFCDRSGVGEGGKGGNCPPPPPHSWT